MLPGWVSLHQVLLVCSVLASPFEDQTYTYLGFDSLCFQSYGILKVFSASHHQEPFQNNVFYSYMVGLFSLLRQLHYFSLRMLFFLLFGIFITLGFHFLSCLNVCFPFLTGGSFILFMPDGLYSLSEAIMFA
jgi:hypothetical protein